MVLIAVTCPYCQSDQIVKRGKTDTGKQRYRCQHAERAHQSFLLNLAYKGRSPEIKAQIIDPERALACSALNSKTGDEIA